jgi:hypothetical protein
MEVLQRTANRGSISTGGYEIANSLKFEADNSEQLSRDVSSTGSRTTATVSMWIKRTELGAAQYLFTYGNTDNDNGRTLARFQSDDTLRIMGGNTTWRNTNRVFRDTSAWYHIVIAFDTTQSTANDRIKLYINGVQETSFSTTNNPSEDGILGLNFQKQVIGYNSIDGGSYFSGYMAEIVHQEGTASAPTEFGETDSDTGIWIPKNVSGVTFGTNGFYLDFEDNTSAGKDSSGNSNNFSDTNLSAADHAIDTPTNNFAIISNAMRDNNELSYSTVSDGGSLFRTTVTEKWVTSVSSIGVTKGKWYAEFNVIGSRPNNWWGIASMEQLNNNSGYSSAGSHLGESGKNWSIGYYQANGRLDEQQNSGFTQTLNWGGVVSQNQIVGVALDMDNHNLYIAVNNTYQNSGDPTSGATGTGAISFDDTETVAIANTGYSLGSGNDTITGYNFGGYRTGGLPSNATDGNGYGAFRYAPPSGYYALCTKNLAEYG